MWVSGLLWISLSVWSMDFQSYCKKTTREKISVQKQELICICIDKNYTGQLSASEREWLMLRSRGKTKDAHLSARQKSIIDIEFQTFRDCSKNFKHKSNADDLGVPDDIGTP